MVEDWEFQGTEVSGVTAIRDQRVMPARNRSECRTAAAAALIHLAAGEPVGVPTDTVYGLAAFANDEASVRRLFELKRRPLERTIALLVSEIEAAGSLISLTPEARRLAQIFWPGPLTIVAPRLPAAPAHLGIRDTLGVRVPDEAIIIEMAAAGALAVTSANIHGAPTPATAHGVAEQFPDVPLVVDAGARPGSSSTVVDMTGASPKVLREGPVSLNQIVTVANRSR